MPRFRSRHRLEGQEDSPAARKMNRFNRLLKKARSMFRHSGPIEPSPPLAPLNHPALPDHVGDLLSEIDGELSLIRDNTVADHSSSTLLPHPLEQGTSAVTIDSTGRRTSEDLSAGPTTSSSHAFISSPHPETSASTHTSGSFDQYTASYSGGSNLAPHQLHTPGAISEQTVQFPGDSSPGSSSGGPVGTPVPSSVLDVIRYTQRNTHEPLPSNTEIEQKNVRSYVRDTEVKSSPNPREDLLAARTVFKQQDASESSSFTSTNKHHSQITASHGTELSTDVAKQRCFESPVAGLSANLGLLSLFSESETMAASEAGQPDTAVRIPDPPTSSMRTRKTLYFAQPLSEVEKCRRTRHFFAQRLEEALAEQEIRWTAKFVIQIAQQRIESEAAEQERYDRTAGLHNIELLNLQDDHEAETKELVHTTKDLRSRLADKEKSVRNLRREKDLLTSQNRETQTQLREKHDQFNRLLQAFQEREAVLLKRTKGFHVLKKELDRTKNNCERSMRDSQHENAKLQHSYTELVERYSHLLTQLDQSNLDKQRNEAQAKTAHRHLEAVQTALREQEQANGTLKARYDHVVAEKAKDYSWHVSKGENPLALKPMSTEDDSAKATEQLHETLEQAELSADLRCQLESVQASNKAKFKKLKRVIANQGQEKAILEMALTMAQGQREHWAEQYDEMADAVASKLSFSSYARGIAERHILLQHTRYMLESQLLEAKLRGDRAVLECAIRQRHETIKLEKRDAEIAELKRKLGIMKQKFDYENGMALLYKDVINKEVPCLRARNSEVERLLQDQITNNVNARHRAVFDDLHSRIHDLKAAKQYWENKIDTCLQEYSSLQTEWSMLSCTVFYDLSNARGWRDDRDRLELENVTLRERFADELVNEPLVIPNDKKTRKQIEEDFKLESIDDLLLKQFAYSYKAVPRQLVATDAPPWEHLRVELQEDLDAQRKRWLAERDAGSDTSCDDGVEIANDHEWIDDLAGGLEATWKGKGKMVGEGIGPDGQIITGDARDSAWGDPTADFF